MNEGDDTVLHEIKKQQKIIETIQSHKMKTIGGVNNIIKIVEKFIKKEKLICYGGTALNNMLPETSQFYTNVDIPDYDFFSPDPIKHAKELADLFYKKGYLDVEAKAGVHAGTYKVFVNFLGIADITYLPQNLFTKLQKECSVKNEILYVPPNYLLMMIFNELSSPNGNISRWEKVYKRFSLFIKYYPLQVGSCVMNQKPTNSEKNIYDIIKQFSSKNNDLVLLGAHARELYKIVEDDVDCIFISKDFEQSTKLLILLLWKHTKNIDVKKHPEFHEFLPEHYEILVDNKTVAIIFDEFNGQCYNYNRVNKLNIATTDTLLTIYLLFFYMDKPYLPAYFYLCKSKQLFYIQQQNKNNNSGVFKRFSLPCIGNQFTLQDVKKLKKKKYHELKSKKHTDEYEKWFLAYSPMKKEKHGKKSKKSKIDFSTLKIV